MSCKKGLGVSCVVFHSLARYLSCWPGKWALIHCRPSMDQLCIHHLCLRSWGVQSLVLLLGRFGGLSVSGCFIVPQMNCRLAVSSVTRPGNHDTNEKPAGPACNDGRVTTRVDVSEPSQIPAKVRSSRCYLLLSQDQGFSFLLHSEMRPVAGGMGVRG